MFVADSDYKSRSKFIDAHKNIGLLLLLMFLAYSSLSASLWFLYIDISTGHGTSPINLTKNEQECIMHNNIFDIYSKCNCLEIDKSGMIFACLFVFFCTHDS